MEIPKFKGSLETEETSSQGFDPGNGDMLLGIDG